MLQKRSMASHHEEPTSKIHEVFDSKLLSSQLRADIAAIGQKQEIVEVHNHTRQEEIQTLSEMVRQMELAVQQKDAQFAQVQVYEENTHNDMDADIKRLIHGLRIERAACSKLEDDLNKQMKESQTSRSEDLDRGRQEWNTAAVKFEHLVDQHLSEAKGRIAEDLELHKESAEYTQEICDEISHLYTDIEKARTYRADKGEKLADGVRYKLDEIRDAIAAEQRIRQESQNTLLELFGQMGQKLQQELDNSRKERHMGTDRIISLMENVLPKLDKTRAFAQNLEHKDLEESRGAANIAEAASENFKKRRASISYGRKSLLFSRS